MSRLANHCMQQTKAPTFSVRLEILIVPLQAERDRVRGAPSEVLCGPRPT